MTEAEWLSCDIPHWMLNHLRPWKRRGRKMCLYVCASCCRRTFWDGLKEPGRTLLDVAERHADGLAGPEEYMAAKRAVTRMTKRDRLAGGEDGPPLSGQVLLLFLRLRHLPGWEGAAGKGERCDYLGDDARRTREALRSRGLPVISEEHAIVVQREHDTFMDLHTHLIRDIFGNPFRPAILDPIWLTPKARNLAQFIYDDRAFGGLSTLADILEEGGCNNEDILSHCRGPRTHVRGCWVVDLVLGKE